MLHLLNPRIVQSGKSVHPPVQDQERGQVGRVRRYNDHGETCPDHSQYPATEALRHPYGTRLTLHVNGYVTGSISIRGG